jgi:hypothetical protein
MADEKKVAPEGGIWTDLGGYAAEGGKMLFNVFSIVIHKAFQLLLFFILAIFFIPSYLIVTIFNKAWTTLLADLFGM